MSAATLVFNARHQIHACWEPPAADEGAMERAKAEEKARCKAKKELDEDEEDEKREKMGGRG